MKERNNRPQGLTFNECVNRTPPCQLPSIEGGFLCFKTLTAKRKNECQQCQYEHSKSHKVFKIEMILIHMHHPHSM